jgi:hypothetical protein
MTSTGGELDPGGIPADRIDRWPRTVAISGAFAAGLSCVLAAVYLVHRAPCPPNYVRLIDGGLVVLALQTLLLLSELVVARAAGGPGRHRVAGAFAVLLALGALAFLLPTLAAASSTFGSSPFDTGCWTF